MEVTIKYITDRSLDMGHAHLELVSDEGDTFFTTDPNMIDLLENANNITIACYVPNIPRYGMEILEVTVNW